MPVDSISDHVTSHDANTSTLMMSCEKSGRVASGFASDVELLLLSS